jgi:hypothetical protein
MSEVRESSPLRTLLVLLAPCLLSTCLRAQYGGGTGEPNDPYLLYTPAQMNAIGTDPNHWDRHFKLMADIDLSQYTGDQFNLIGYHIAEEDPNNRPFRGVFDGNGHVISHFRYAAADQNEIGLFRCVGDVDSEIRDLTLADPNVSVPGGRNVGSLIGYLQHGGMVRCRTKNGVVRGQENVGGLVGKGGPEVTRVTANSRVYPAMSDCGFTGVVTATRYAGGLVGFNLTGQITGCCATGQVTATEGAGGLAGTHGYGGLTNCYAIVAVVGGKNVGGLAGDSFSVIANCYAAGTISGVNNVGGLVGAGSHEVTGSFWDTQTSGQSTSAGGMGKTTGEMQRAGTFFFWNTCDSETTWTIDEGKDYPRLQWEGRGGQVIDLVPLDVWLAGHGTNEDPYLIYTVEELSLIPLYPCEMDKHYKLMADIDLSVYTNGQFNIPYFSGSFDGNHHTIANFTYTGISRDWVGLFAYIWSGSIKDVNLIDPQVDIGTRYGAGALVGSGHAATITNCHVKGGRISGRAFVGGLVGVIDGAICDCSATATVAGYEAVGGLVGSYGEGTATHCSTSGSITGTYETGGLVGRNGGTIVECYASGNVAGDTDIGGLIGMHGRLGMVDNCYATANVAGVAYVGGLVGFNGGVVVNSYAASKIDSETANGGLIGSGQGSVIGSFWDTEISGKPWSVGGTGKTTGEMKKASTFSAWNAQSEEAVWTIVEGADYPRLRWENRPGDTIKTFRLSDLFSGTGTAADPYLVHTADGLNRIGLYPQDWDKNFRLTADIDLSTCVEKSFNVIGVSGMPFRGIFDGAGHTVSHFRYEYMPLGSFSYRQRCDSIGLFGCVNDPCAVIRNLGLIDPDLSAMGGTSMGALVGTLEDGTVVNCYAKGGTVWGYDYWDVGGLIGSNSGMVAKCHTDGKVVSQTGSVGGLIGSNAGRVFDCYATAEADDGWAVGGLIGSDEGEVVHCYATGPVFGERNSGGLIGYEDSGVVLACFWDVQTSKQATSAAGTGATTAQMKMAYIFIDAGWDFLGETDNGTADIWWIEEGQDYPRLAWELESDGSGSEAGAAAGGAVGDVRESTGRER